MNQRILKKQLGIKSTMKLRDFYGAILSSDMPEDLEYLKGHIDVKKGDMFFLFSFEAPILKRKRKFPWQKKQKAPLPPETK